MKFPKLLNGPTATGESFSRALDNVDAPFITRVGLDSVAQKKGYQTQVDQGGSFRWLWVSYTTINRITLITRAGAIDTQRGRVDSGLAGQSLVIGDGGNWRAPVPMTFLGDNYILNMMKSEGDDTADTVYWATFTPPYNPGICLPAGQATRRGAATLIDQDNFYAHTSADLSLSSFATGAMGARGEGNGGGYSYLSFADPDRRYDTKVPVVMQFNTKDKQVSNVPTPYIAGRNHLDFSLFTTGKGRVEYILGVEETMDHSEGGVTKVFKPKKKLNVVVGTNHARTLTPYVSQFFDDILYEHPVIETAAGPKSDRRYYNNEQLQYLTKHATFIYLGDNKSLLFIPNGYDSGKEAEDYVSGENDATSFAIYRPMMFVGRGGNYTRLSWPGDNWRVNRTGYPDFGYRDGVFYPDLKEKNLVGFRRDPSCRKFHWAFGRGCAYIPVHHEDEGWKFVITKDFGASWTTVDAPPYLTTAHGGGPNGAVIRPYKSSSSKGEIVFVARIPGTVEIHLYRTDGDFTEFKRIFKMKGKTDGLTFPETLTYSAEDQVIYFGGDKGPQYLFPAFPGEFES